MLLEYDFNYWLELKKNTDGPTKWSFQKRCQSGKKRYL